MLAGDLDKAAEALRKCLEFNSQHADALRDLGIVLLELGDAPKAIGVLQRAVHAAPDSAVAWIALGVARHRNRDLLGAGAALEQAARLQPHSVQVYLSLAELSLDGGQPRRAQTEARKARDNLGTQASPEQRKRVELLLVRTIVVANLADALCRGQKDGDALQAAVAKELQDEGLQDRASEAASVGAESTDHIKAAQARCKPPEAKGP